MENIIYDELSVRGYNVDVRVIEKYENRVLIHKDSISTMF